MGRNLLALGLAVTVLSVGSVAFAQQSPPSPQQPPSSGGGAIEFGARVGFGVPLGSEGRTAGDTASNNLSDDLSAVLPLWLDVGYRINPNVYVGAFFQYAFGFINNDQNPMCSQSGVSCSASDIRLGANVHYHFSPGQPFDPWFGLGVGYEWLKLGVSATGNSADVTAGAIEFANLQLGGDFMVSPTFSCGPFVSFSLGQYQSIKVSGGGMSINMDITDKAMHEWLLFGFKGAFDIGI
jgi:opacity protein-like surface antigen